MIQLLPYQSVNISENRQRREFDPARLMELTDSLRANGLLHPIVVRPPREDEASGGVMLVAGERRMRAIIDLWNMGDTLRFAGEAVPEGFLPCTNLGDLPPLQAEEAELEENVQRVDLTLQERCAAVGRLADLRTRQAEAAGLPPPTVAAIAEEVRGSSVGDAQTNTRKEIILSRHLDNPAVAKATSLKEAWKALRRTEEREQNRARAEAVGQIQLKDRHQVVNCDSLRWMLDCNSEQFDVIVTDPPYGMGADEFGDSGGVGGAVGGHGYTDDQSSWRALMDIFVPESFRTAKPQAHLYCFCDLDNFSVLRLQLSRAGWQVFRTPLIFHKPGGMRAPWPEMGPQRKYETILYAVKGKRPVTLLSGDVITIPADSNLGHSAQKPVALYQELLRRSVRPGDSVLDPFAGTGPILPAAHALKCYATALELDAASYGICLKRLEGIT